MGIALRKSEFNPAAPARSWERGRLARRRLRAGETPALPGARRAVIAVAFLGSALLHAADSRADFTEKYCAKCHNDVDKEGGLDLTSLAFAPGDAANFQRWVDVHDKLQAGEMPPKDKKQPTAAERASFVRELAATLIAQETKSAATQGRATQRRLNRYEYENALRDLFHAPWLNVKNDLPEDGEAELFNKIGDVLDVSHVQMTRYLKAANVAIRHALGVELQRSELPPPTKTRYYAREHPNLTRTFHSSRGDRPFNQSPERSTFPVFGIGGDPEVRKQKAPVTVGESDPEKRELEGVGWMRGNYHPFHTIWDNFRAPVAGRYHVRWLGYTIWVGPNGLSTAQVVKGSDRRGAKWNSPDGDAVTRGRRNEPITIYAQGPIDVRRLGEFDLTPEPSVHDIGNVMLVENEALVTDASRFFRDRPGSVGNPLAQRDGAPAVAFRWMEVEGPLWDEDATAGYRLMFGDLPLKRIEGGDAEVAVQALPPTSERGSQGAGGYGRVVRTQEVSVRVESKKADDAERLLRDFMHAAYRRPVEESEVQRYLAVIAAQRKAGHDFTYAQIAGYTAVLCSPGFLYLEESPGRLDDDALASRLAFFLSNSPPDAALRAHVDCGDLRRPDVLRAETDRLLNAPGAERFVNAFLDYWLELRKHDATTPSNTLYPDYYLDEALVEAALAESRMFFTELLRQDLPARNVIDSDSSFLNERLAVHYGILGVEGAAMRRVTLPPGCVRGGVMTQAIVLKVTANGTTTSPVIRGRWITERILGRIVPPPPSSVAAVDPDTRGAVTIRQQLDKHRNDKTCAACHNKIDPQGFALENFDVMGGWRDRYRGDAKDHVPEIGIGKNGWPFDFYFALPVDAHGELVDGRKFNGVREFKQLLLADEAQIARNLARQLTIYATGAPVRFSDRPQIERILAATKAGGYGVRSMVHAIVQSELFLNK